jgi:hypothetical protein
MFSILGDLAANPLGDPPALPGRQQQFDKCRSLPLAEVEQPRALELRNLEYRISEYRTAEPHFEVHDSLFDILRFTKRNIHDAFGCDQAPLRGWQP